MLLWNPKVYCHVHIVILVGSILSQLNLVHILVASFSNIHFNIIFPSGPDSNK
jgi:hypothetical protein